MENKITNQRLINILVSANLSAVNCRKLENIFTAGASQMKRKFDLKDIEKLKAKIHEEAYRWKCREEMVSAINPGMNIGGTSKILSSFIARPRTDTCLEQTTSARQLQNQQTCGNVMICVGKGGIPDDVTVVCVSRLARESGSTEDKIIEEFRKQGKTLFLEFEFYTGMDIVTNGVRQGKFSLPLSTDQLPFVRLAPRVGVENTFFVQKKKP